MMEISSNRQWIPQLSEASRIALSKHISTCVVVELQKRGWGSFAHGNPQNGIPNLIVNDYRGLMSAIGSIRYFMTKKIPENFRIHYRGQRSDWSIKPSVFRLVKNRKQQKSALDLLNFWQCAVASNFDQNGTIDEREALCQHYGMPTRFIDIVDHIQSALWFASEGKPDNTSIAQTNGYIYLMAFSEIDITLKKLILIDLRDKPSEWIRPHVQQALVYRENPDRINDQSLRYVVAKFTIPATLMATWSNSNCINSDYFFPPAVVDSGRDFYERATSSFATEIQTFKNGSHHVLLP